MPGTEVVDAGGGRIDHEPRILHVPVSVCSANIVTIRTGQLWSGERVGLGFTSAAGLAAVFGTGQTWILIHVRSLHAMLASRGIHTVQVDPVTRPPARLRAGSAPRKEYTTAL